MCFFNDTIVENDVSLPGCWAASLLDCQATRLKIAVLLMHKTDFKIRFISLYYFKLVKFKLFYTYKNTARFYVQVP
jgi:hypothetical protein